MAGFNMSRAVLVFAVIGLYNVHVIHLAESDIESKVDILEYLLHSFLKHEIADIKDTLRTIINDKPDHGCCKAGQQQPGLNQTSGDGIQRLVDEVTTKTKAMIKAFSVEKKQIQRQKTYLAEALSTIRVSVDEHVNQTRDLEDQMKDGHQQLITEIEILRQQSQQSQQKCDSVKQLLETLSADIDSIKSNIDGINRTMNPMIDSMRCKAGWTRQLDSCIIYIETASTTWSKAQDYCKGLGGYLVEPYSAAAFALLMEGANRTENWNDGYDSKWRLWWIGATDRVQEGVWRWESTGQKIGIIPKWNNGEPNNQGGSEDCAILVYSKYGINDVKCDSHLPHFICEIKHKI